MKGINVDAIAKACFLRHAGNRKEMAITVNLRTWAATPSLSAFDCNRDEVIVAVRQMGGWLQTSIERTW